MGLWRWLVGYVLLFALIHLLLYYFYVRGGNDQSTTSPFTERNRTSPYSFSAREGYSNQHEEYDDRSESEPAERHHEPAGDTIRCPHCGARNASDQTYTYCWNCVSTLRR